MADKMFVAVFLCVFIARACAQNCNPYDTTSHQCSALDKNTATYKDTHTELIDASRQEHMADFVLNTTLGLYMYLHPCMTTQEAALRLFYDQTTVPDQSSNWWSEMATVIGGHGSPLVGRRRRAHYGSDTALLYALLDKIRAETGHQGSAECIQALIDEFKGAAATTFKAKFGGNFYVPTTHAPTTTHPTTTTTTTTTTTPRPTTTTPRPTTTTTTTTTPAPSTTPAPVAAMCTTCSQLACLLSPTFGQCNSDLEEFCLTTVVARPSGTEIARGCATRTECKSTAWANDPECNEIQSHVLSSGVTCRYCCSGDNCNRPPQLLPAAETIYHAP